MRKLLSILTLSAIFSVGAMAQEQGGSFGNKQATVVLGNNPMFDQSGEYYLPQYGSSTKGLAKTPGYYLDLNEVGSNSMLNMVGVQFSYFITDAIEANAMFSMNINATPKKDFVEGVDLKSELSIPAGKHIEGRLTSNWFANVGGNYHFFLGQKKNISTYAGARFGGMMSRIQTAIPYTGDDESAYVYKSSRSGQAKALQAALIGGIDCVLNCGIVLGLEVAPFSYQYSVIQIDPEGTYKYACDMHSVKILSTPTLKFGFRF